MKTANADSQQAENKTSAGAAAVRVGSRVEIAVNGTPRVLTIVPAGGADVENGKISADAPLAQLILGLSVGQSARGTIAGREAEISVTRIL